MIDVVATKIPDVKLITPSVFEDERGYFMQTWHHREFAAAGIEPTFVQDNHSRSVAGTLRGLHYQLERPQGKLVRAVVGEIFDVAVDLRRSSQTFGRWAGARLSGENKKQLWIPPGFAHGFLVLSPSADVVYKCTDYYAPETGRALRWNDDTIGIRWPLKTGEAPLLSPKDADAGSLADCDLFP